MVEDKPVWTSVALKPELGQGGLQVSDDSRRVPFYASGGFKISSAIPLIKYVHNLRFAQDRRQAHSCVEQRSNEVSAELLRILISLEPYDLHHGEAGVAAAAPLAVKDAAKLCSA